jgi:hypothetical protein
LQAWRWLLLVLRRWPAGETGLRNLQHRTARSGKQTDSAVTPLLLSLDTLPDHSTLPCACCQLPQAFLCRISYSEQQQQLVLGVQPSHLLMPQASAAMDPTSTTSHLVPLCCPEIGPGDTIAAHAHKLHSLMLDLAPHAMTSLPDICTAAGVTPAAGSSPQKALFRAAVVYARDAAAGRAAAAGLDVVLLLLPGPKPGSRHVLQALLLTSQGLFSQDGAGSMARHFEVGTGQLLCVSYSRVCWFPCAIHVINVIQ